MVKPRYGTGHIGHPRGVLPNCYQKSLTSTVESGSIGFLPTKGHIMCEDFPCCGHETGDCNGQKYGSDESIIAAEYARMEREDYMDDGYFGAWDD